MKQYFTTLRNIKSLTKKSLIVFLFFLHVLNAYSANRYWVGGSGSWDNPAKWSATDGGPGGASVPLSVDDVFFTTLSGFSANNRTITIPIGPSNLARNITVNTGLNPSIIFTGTGRLDIYGSVVLESNMTFTNWTGNMHFYMGIPNGTNTITTKENIFHNLLIRFENNFPGNFIINDVFSHAIANNRRTEIQLVNKTNTITFNNLVKVANSFVLLSGSCYMMQGFDNYILNGPSSIIIHNNTIFHSLGNGSLYRFFNYGEAYLHGKTYTFNGVYGGESVSPDGQQVLDIEDCTIYMSGTNAVWRWGRGLPNTFKSSNSIINFSSDASSFYPYNLTFNVVNIEGNTNYGNEYFNIVFEATTPTSSSYTPLIDSLIIKHNCLFSIVSNNFKPRIQSLLHFKKGHSYFTNIADNVTLGTTFNIEMLAGSKFDMSATCTKPIWLNKMAFHFNSNVTIVADNIISTNILASGPSIPYNIGANSYIMPYTTHVGWNIGTPIHRDLVWVGPVPSDINNEFTYSVWGDENNWRDLSVDPAAIAGPGFIGGTPVCPPTHVDSVIFPNNSYVFCDANISYTEGMNWLGRGRIFGNSIQEIEVWGSLHLSTLMLNDFKGTFWFRSDRPYRCHITTNNQAFDRGIVFNSANGDGSWELKDTLKVPIVDIEDVGTNRSLRLSSGHLHTGNILCSPNNGQTIIVAGMSLTGGSLHLYDSDVYVYGDAGSNTLNFYAGSGVAIHAGTSHVFFSDVFNTNDATIPNVELGPNHKYYNITLSVPAAVNYTSRTHYINLNNNIIHHVNIEPNTSVIFGGTGVNQIKKINIQTNNRTYLCGRSMNNPTYNNNNQMIIDSLIAKGHVDFGHFTKILSYIELSPGYVYNFGTSTTGNTSITLQLSGPIASGTHPSYVCPVIPYSYPGAKAVFPGTCSNPIYFNNGQIQVFTPIPITATYVHVNNNTAIGPYVPIVTLGGSLFGTTIGWNGSEPAPRKLRWVDVSGVSNNVGNWNDEDYWEQILPVFQPAPQCPPTRIDTVLFDNTSFTAIGQRVNINLSMAADVASMYWDNIPQWWQPELFSPNIQYLNIYANLRFHQHMKQNFGGEIIFRGTPTVQIPNFEIFTANKEFKNHIYFVGGSDNTTWHLLDTIHMPTKNLYLNRGNLITQGNGLNLHSFFSTTNTKRFIDISNATVTLRGQVGAFGVWNVSGDVSDGVVTLFDINSENSVLQNVVSDGHFTLGGRKYNVIKSTSGAVTINPSAFRRDTINHLIDAPGGITSTASSVSVNSIYIRKAEFNRPVNINSSPGYYDSVYFAQNATFLTNNKFLSYVYFPPGKTYTFNVGTVQWFENDCQVDLIGTINNNIQFYSSSTAQTAYLRKDSGFFCADYINMRDITAVGNGQNPVGCTSYGQQVNTFCSPVSPNSWVVSACDTITDLSSPCGPWVVFDTNRGRADFNAGENADLQGNVFGWAKRDYGTIPYVTLTDYSPVTICQGDKVPITYLITGQLPISLKTKITKNGASHFDEILFMNADLFSGGSGSQNDPYIYHDTIVAQNSDLSIVISNISVNVFRCFNSEYLNTNSKTITINPVPYDIVPIAYPNPVCNGSKVYIKANSAIVNQQYQVFSAQGGTLIGSFLPGDSLQFGPVFNDTTLYITGHTLAGCSFQVPLTIFANGPCVADLSVVKTANNMNPPVGTNIIFTVTVANNGPSNANNIVVTDLLPAGYTIVSATPSTGSWNNPNWSVGNLGWHETATITIIATVQPNQIGNYSNTAVVTGNEPDPNPANNSSTITPEPLQIADLQVMKSVNNISPKVGETVVFTITVINNGPSNATGIVVNDVVPAGFTIISAVPSVGVWNFPNWIIGAMNVGSTQSLTITALVNPNQIGNYSNTVIISGNVIDPDTTNNISIVNLTPVQLAELELTKTVSKNTPNVSEQIEFLLTLTNNGISHATGVVVQDILPSGYTYVNHVASHGTYASAIGIWSVGGILVNSTATLAITVTVNPPVANVVYLNTASITQSDQLDPIITNNTDNADITPQQSDLEVLKTVDNLSPQVGEQVTFTISVSNNGADIATNVVIIDLLANGFSYISHVASIGTYNSNTGLWTIGTMTVGQNEELTITATVNAPLSDVIFSNLAEVHHSDQYDPVVSNNQSSLTVVPIQSDLAITKTVDILIPGVGETVTFTVVVTNNGPNDANNIIVSEQLPNGYTYVSSSTSQGAFNNISGVWTVGNISNGASATLTIQVIVNEPGDGIAYNNQVVITNADEYDPDLSNNSDNASVVSHQSDLAVVKTANNITPYVGEQITFTIVATNNGTHYASGVRVTDVINSGYTFISAVTSTGAWIEPDWFIGNLAVGEIQKMTITAIVKTSGIYSNTAVITGNDFDQDTTNNSSTILVDPLPVTDLSVVKSVSNETPSPGDNIIFTLTATNYGPSQATGVTVTDVLQGGYVFVSASPSIGSWGNDIWNIGVIEQGETATLNITVRVNPTGPYPNTATIEGTEFDPDLTNNTSTITILSDLNIPRGFSPNGDGVNDTFIIRGAENYPNNTLTIYNRWGNKVYEAQPYQNDWNGTAMFGVTYGIEDLPVGTYFFIFDMGDDQGYVKGYVYLSR